MKKLYLIECKGWEFECASGQCVGCDKRSPCDGIRCDKIFDCKDGSDEWGCSKSICNL